VTFEKACLCVFLTHDFCLSNIRRLFYKKFTAQKLMTNYNVRFLMD